MRQHQSELKQKKPSVWDTVPHTQKIAVDQEQQQYGSGTGMKKQDNQATVLGRSRTFEHRGWGGTQSSLPEKALVECSNNMVDKFKLYECQSD